MKRIGAAAIAAVNKMIPFIAIQGQTLEWKEIKSFIGLKNFHLKYCKIKNCPNVKFAPIDLKKGTFFGEKLHPYSIIMNCDFTSKGKK